jgi:hypothetical protein
MGAVRPIDAAFIDQSKVCNGVPDCSGFYPSNLDERDCP